MNTNPATVCHKTPKFSTQGIWLGQNPLDYSLPLLTMQLVLVFTTIRIIYYLIKPLKQPKVVAEVLVSHDIAIYNHIICNSLPTSSTLSWKII